MLLDEEHIHSEYLFLFSPSFQQSNMFHTFLLLSIFEVIESIVCRNAAAFVISYMLNVSYTKTYRDLQQNYRDVQENYQTRDFVLECSISAPVRSSVHRNGTYPTLKTFPRFFKLSEFRGRRSSGRLRKRGLDLYNFITEIGNLCCWRLNCPEDIQLSYRKK